MPESQEQQVFKPSGKFSEKPMVLPEPPMLHEVNKQGKEEQARLLEMREIRAIVRQRIKEEWRETGVPVDEAVIDQELETAARDLISRRNIDTNPNPGDLTGANKRWYITRPLTLDQYLDHRHETDSGGAELSSPIARFAVSGPDGKTWGVAIDAQDNPKYPARREGGIRLAKRFRDVGFPLTQETAQRYLSPAPDVTTTK